MPAPATLADLHAAIAWRLRGIGAEMLQNGAEAIFRLVHAGEGAAPPENAMAAILAGLGIGCEGKATSVFHALLAVGAEEADDLHVFYPSAFLVLEVHRQAQRASRPRGGDALDAVIRKLAAELPDWPPAMLWAELAHRADGAGCDVVCDYDAMADTITFEPRPGAALRDLTFSAFARRLQRVRSSRREPANVVAPSETAMHELPRLAA